MWEPQLLYFDTLQFPHLSLRKEHTLVHSFLCRCSRSFLLNGTTLPRRLHYFYQLVWSGVMYYLRVMVYFYVLWLWFFSRTYWNNYSHKQTPTKVSCIFFYHPSREANYSDITLARLYCIWSSEVSPHSLISHTVVLLAGMFSWIKFSLAPMLRTDITGIQLILVE